MIHAPYAHRIAVLSEKVCDRQESMQGAASGAQPSPTIATISVPASEAGALFMPVCVCVQVGVVRDTVIAESEEHG
jgi:hypothetical protein